MVRFSWLEFENSNWSVLDRFLFFELSPPPLPIGG